MTIVRVWATKQELKLPKSRVPFVMYVVRSTYVFTAFIIANDDLFRLEKRELSSYILGTFYC